MLALSPGHSKQFTSAASKGMIFKGQCTGKPLLTGRSSADIKPLSEPAAAPSGDLSRDLACVGACDPAVGRTCDLRGRVWQLRPGARYHSSHTRNCLNLTDLIQQGGPHSWLHHITHPPQRPTLVSCITATTCPASQMVGRGTVCLDLTESEAPQVPLS